MFGALWPGFDADDVPITSVTNGVHAPTWTDPALRRRSPRDSFGTVRHDRASTGRRRASATPTSGRVRGAHARAARATMPGAGSRDGVARAEPRRGRSRRGIDELLDPDVLTIGFARRVPTYKRLTLMLHDRERLRALLTHPERPVQIVDRRQVASGRRRGQAAHPGARASSPQEPEVRERIVFLPELRHRHGAAALPGHRRLAEQPAAPARGVRHVRHEGGAQRRRSTCRSSTAGGTSSTTARTAGRSRRPTGAATARSATRSRPTALYDLIEHQIAPRFYDRDDDGVPRALGASIRHTLATLSPELLGRPHGARVRRAPLPAGRRGRDALCRADHFAARRASSPPGSARVDAAWPKRARSRTSSPAASTRCRRSATSCTCARTSTSADSAPDDVASRSSTGAAGDERRARRRRTQLGSSPSPRRVGRMPQADVVRGHGAARPGRQLRLHRARRAARTRCWRRPPSWAHRDGVGRCRRLECAELASVETEASAAS